MKPESEDRTLFQEAREKQGKNIKHGPHRLKTIGMQADKTLNRLEPAIHASIVRSIENKLDLEEKHGPVYSIDPKTGERKEIKR